MAGGYFPEQPGKKRPAIGYGGYFDADPPMAQSDLTPEQREILLKQITGRNEQATGLLFDALDYGGSYLRGALAGKPGEQASEDEVLQNWDSLPDEDALGGWGRPLARFAVGATADPLNFIPLGGLSKAGRAVKNAGLLDDAVRVASRRAIQAGDIARPYAQNALEEWATNFGKGVNDLSDADLLARPLVGPREAKRSTNLGEMIAAQSNPAQAETLVNNALTRSGKKATDLASQPLSYDIGLGLPFSDTALIGANIPGGGAYARGMDKFMQGLRWSTAGRYSHSLFNKDVSGATDSAGQIEAMKINAQDALGEAIGRGEASRLLQPIAHHIQNPGTAASMRRALNGVPNANDLQLLSNHPELQQFVDDWDPLAEKYLTRRAEAGLPSHPLRDEYGTKYFPRHVDDIGYLDEIERAGAAGGRGTAFSRKTGDSMARQKPFHTPNGEDIINDLSIDPEVASVARNAATDEDAAKYIKKAMDQEAASAYPGGLLPNGQPVPEYSMERARRMARVLHLRDSKAVTNKIPMFGNNFAEDFSRYIVGNERAIKVNNALLDSIAGAAKPLPYNQVDQGKHVPLRQGLKELGLLTDVSPNNNFVLQKKFMNKWGAEPELLKRLENRFGPGVVDELKKGSIDRDALRRLTRMADYYAVPRAQSDLIKTMDGLTRLWKSSILSWPAKFARDWYGGAFINAVEVGNGMDMLRGYSATKHLLQGDLKALDAIIQHVPAYKSMNPQQRLAQFQRDMASGGAVEGTRSLDYGDFLKDSASGRQTVDSLIPGMNKETTLGYQFWDAATLKKPLSSEHAAYSELTKGWDKVMKTGAFAGNERDVGNPIMRWSAKLGNTTDKINRMSGIISLMLQGVDPMEAIRRMKAAHIDYGSLTKFEREGIRRLVPFWSFNSRIGKWVTSQIWNHPGGRFTQFGLRAPQTMLQTDDEGYVPESIRSSYGMPTNLATPFASMSGQPGAPGVTSWLNDIDLPGVDLLNLVKPTYKPSGGLDMSGTLWNTTENVVGNLAHPYVKGAFEATTGIDSFTKRPIKEMQTAAGQLAEDMLGIPQDSMWGQRIKQLKPAFDALPFAPRALQISNRLLDDDKVPLLGDRAYQMGVNAFTGVKFQNVDDEQRRVDARKKIADMMMEDPLVRSFTQPFIPEAAKPFVSPHLQQMMSLDRQLGRELKAERDMRSGARPKKRRNTDPMSYFA